MNTVLDFHEIREGSFVSCRVGSETYQALVLGRMEISGEPEKLILCRLSDKKTNYVPRNDCELLGFKDVKGGLHGVHGKHPDCGPGVVVGEEIRPGHILRVMLRLMDGRNTPFLPIDTISFFCVQMR